MKKRMNQRVKVAALAAFAAVIAVASHGGTAETLKSPDGRIEVRVSVGDTLEWSLSRDGHALVVPSRLGLAFAKMPAIGAMKVTGRRERSSDSTWKAPIYHKAEVRDRYNELEIMLEETACPDGFPAPRKLGLVFRAYDEGAAFRYVVPEQDGFYGFELTDELTEWRFAGDPECWASEFKSHKTSQEGMFNRKRLGAIPPESLVGLPLVIRTAGQSVALCEAALSNWAGLFYRACGADGTNATVKAALTPLPAPYAAVKDSKVVRRTPAASPWRVAICGSDELDLIRRRDIIINLNPPPDKSIDFSWVKPGTTSWDWWVDSNNSLSTDLTLRLIDFSAEMGWQYHTIDGGWYGFGRSPNRGPDVIPVPRRGFDLDRIVAHAREKGIGIWVWICWVALEDNGIEETFADFERRGICGVKVDFLDRQDQWMVRWYEKVLRIAARHHIMVNFHGAFKPTGTERTWPNNLTREGVMGNEYCKWSNSISPEHTATLPFTRYLLGPGDFTPGSFANVYSTNFVPHMSRGHRYGDETDRRQIWAEEIGTRAHAIALCIVYDSYLTTLCDWPERYRGAYGIEALRSLPTTWKNTRPVEGRIGEFYSVVREANDGSFYYAAITVAPRRAELKLDFLGDGDWVMETYADHPEYTPKDACGIKQGRRFVKNGELVTFDLLKEGGAVAIFRRAWRL